MRDLYILMPRALFEGDYAELSNDAKILYSLLLDRFFEQNESLTEGEKMAVMLSRKEMCVLLRKSRPIVSAVMKELMDFDLVYEKREGIGQTKKIYVATI